MKKLLLVGLVASLLAGCQSSASRMAECQAEGVSRDACYMAEQNRKASVNNAALSQAMSNAQHAVQHGQAARHHEKREWKLGADTFRVNSATGHASLNGQDLAVTEMTADAIVYSSPDVSVIKYTSGKIALLHSAVFTGYMH